MEFKDGDAAQKAMLRLNGKIIPNSQPVSIAWKKLLVVRKPILGVSDLVQRV